MHKGALITGIVLSIIGLALLIWGLVRKSQEKDQTTTSSLTLGLLIGGGILIFIGIILMLIGGLHKSEPEVEIQHQNTMTPHPYSHYYIPPQQTN